MAILRRSLNCMLLSLTSTAILTVTKSDREEGTPQGDATLAGAVYGIYKGETLVDKYVTDKNGQFNRMSFSSTESDDFGGVWKNTRIQSSVS